MNPEIEYIYETKIIKSMTPRAKYSKAKLQRKIPADSTQANKIIERLKKNQILEEHQITKTTGFKPKKYFKYYSLTNKGYQEQLKIKGIL